MKKIRKLLVVCLSLMMSMPVDSMHYQVLAKEDSMDSSIQSDKNDALNVVEQTEKKAKVTNDAVFQVNDKITAKLVNGVLTMSGSGDMPDYDTVAPWNDYEINEVIIEEGITSVGSRSFPYHYELYDVTLPSTIKRIGEEAFYTCIYLMNVNVPSSLEVIESRAFGKCWELKEFDLNEGLTRIGWYAFQATSITSVNIPSTLTNIHPTSYVSSDVDSYTVSPKNKNFSSNDGMLFNKDQTSLLIYPSKRNNDTYTIPNGIQEIGPYAFLSNGNLKHINFNSSLRTIKEYAFQYAGLVEVKIPATIQKMEQCVFDKCRDLESATIDLNMNKLPTGTFESCEKLKNVTLNDNIELIDTSAFSRCTALESLTLPKKLKKIYMGAFYECTNLKSLDIPASVEYIDAYAFEDCPNLQLNVPSTLTKIENGAYIIVEKINVIGTQMYDYAQEVFKLVNKERAKVGLNPLKLDKKLFDAATIRAAELAVKYSHDRPNGFDCNSAAPLYSIYGENIAAGAVLPQYVMEDWMDSPMHRSNILNAEFESIGVGCFIHDDIPYWVQVFGYESTGELVNVPNNKTASYQINIEPESINLELDKTSLLFKKANEHEQLIVRAHNGAASSYFHADPSSLIWKSDNTNVASVDKAGVVTSKNAGTTTIRVYLENREIATCEVTVKKETVVKNGWKFENGKWYYYNNNVKATGWLNLSGTWYLLSDTGERLSGWQNVGGYWYYFNEDGIMQTGWLNDSGTWYLLADSGYMLTDWQAVGGYWYYFNASGVMQTGWLNLSGTWYLLADSGYMLTGWQEVSGYWYYFSAGGSMQTGWQVIGGYWYYFNAGGSMHTGWLYDSGNWYLLADSGYMLTGWQLVNGTWYYLNSSGVWVA